MIKIKVSRLYALGALNWLVFAYITLIAQNEVDPKKYLLSVLPGYAILQVLFVIGWNSEPEEKKIEEKK